ncbi:hypothetical protein [Pseudoalteromonas luteoviolacea]|uniref:DUF2306 domain-containing protein n=1 Tax=Pseudoalteromonas luteoviolacea S4060-1 TaxID=1365257 RepID=A0A167KR20_9GAMM|nr:hypothetical protein [Pseudoalteromonas luteoviolacea]KZN63142.1 hypothetical protein N478_24480 [Pseudoalteromonas luteoviolacea S4060-1]
MLTLHIIAGSLLLLFGMGALSFAKGKTKHRWSGSLFFLTMLVMAGTAALLNGGATMAMLTFYYGVTAWAVVLRKENTVGLFDILSMCLITYVSISLFYFVSTADIPDTFKMILTIHASVAAMSACLDLKMIINGGISGKHRIVRHTWRACYAMLGAVMSFSANTSDSWPDFIDSNALIYLMIGILFYWLLRVLFTGWYHQLTHTLGKSLLARKFVDARRLLNER